MLQLLLRPDTWCLYKQHKQTGYPKFKKNWPQYDAENIRSKNTSAGINAERLGNESVRMQSCRHHHHHHSFTQHASHSWKIPCLCFFFSTYIEINGAFSSKELVVVVAKPIFTHLESIASRCEVMEMYGNVWKSANYEGQDDVRWCKMM